MERGVRQIGIILLSQMVDGDKDAEAMEVEKLRIWGGRGTAVGDRGQSNQAAGGDVGGGHVAPVKSLERRRAKIIADGRVVRSGNAGDRPIEELGSGLHVPVCAIPANGQGEHMLDKRSPGLCVGHVGSYDASIQSGVGPGCPDHRQDIPGHSLAALRAESAAALLVYRAGVDYSPGCAGVGRAIAIERQVQGRTQRLIRHSDRELRVGTVAAGRDLNKLLARLNNVAGLKAIQYLLNLRV